ncbi:hypothetical protein MAUB1S_11141 [Mycolicibacterium aubagnense]
MDRWALVVTGQDAYVSTMTIARLSPSSCLAALAVALFSTATGFAGEAGKQAAKPLPGVNGGYSIVKPATPQPEPDDYDPASGRQFKVGDTDVRISGSVIVDVGAGNLPAPRR